MNTIDINNLTFGQLKEIAAMFPTGTTGTPAFHPMLGRRCLLRTYSAGVHIGTVKYVNRDNSMEVHLTDALRLWKWEGGGLSLSAVATNGIQSGRLNKTPEVFLTNVIEFIPTTPKAEASYERFIEDTK